MQPSGTGEAGIEGDIQHRLKLSELALGMFHGQELEEPFRADARPTAEETLEMKFAQVNRAGNVRQFRLVQEMFLQVDDGFFDALIIERGLGVRERVRFAAQGGNSWGNGNLTIKARPQPIAITALAKSRPAAQVSKRSCESLGQLTGEAGRKAGWNPGAAI